ncbi:hypothetical protein ACK3SF_04985 [Candidatus Nanosalina sp. VS9-1]|uniref:hypothetical protein n=1 Tax=Candidatus Nanosalina sp. VS9-1 TaxID=3388566 RepID=UPI0039E19F15
MSSDLFRKVARKLDKYENFLEIIFASLLVLSFSMVVIAIVTDLLNFSQASRFYSSRAIVVFMASFLSLKLIADAFKLSVINFTERDRMKTIFTIAIVGTITNILVNTRLSENILDSFAGISAYAILLIVMGIGLYTADRYGFLDI